MRPSFDLTLPVQTVAAALGCCAPTVQPMASARPAPAAAVVAAIASVATESAVLLVEPIAAGLAGLIESAAALTNTTTTAAVVLSIESTVVQPGVEIVAGCVTLSAALAPSVPATESALLLHPIAESLAGSMIAGHAATIEQTTAAALVSIDPAAVRPSVAVAAGVGTFTAAIAPSVPAIESALLFDPVSTSLAGSIESAVSLTSPTTTSAAVLSIEPGVVRAGRRRSRRTGRRRGLRRRSHDGNRVRRGSRSGRHRPGCSIDVDGAAKLEQGAAAAVLSIEPATVQPGVDTYAIPVGIAGSLPPNVAAPAGELLLDPTAASITVCSELMRVGAETITEPGVLITSSLPAVVQPGVKVHALAPGCSAAGFVDARSTMAVPLAAIAASAGIPSTTARGDVRVDAATAAAIVMGTPSVADLPITVQTVTATAAGAVGFGGVDVETRLASPPPSIIVSRQQTVSAAAEFATHTPAASVAVVSPPCCPVSMWWSMGRASRRVSFTWRRRMIRRCWPCRRPRIWPARSTRRFRSSARRCRRRRSCRQNRRRCDLASTLARCRPA